MRKYTPFSSKTCKSLTLAAVWAFRELVLEGLALGAGWPRTSHSTPVCLSLLAVKGNNSNDGSVSMRIKGDNIYEGPETNAFHNGW